MALLGFIFRRGGRSSTAAIKLDIEVRVSGDLRHPKAIYSLVRVDPEMAFVGAVLEPNGNVDLTTIHRALASDASTQLTFQLVGTVVCDGAEHAIEFRRPARRAFNVRNKGGGCVWNGVFRAFFPNPRDLSRLAVFDRNDDGGRYRYCLQIVAPGCRRHGKLDPSIINR